MVYFSCCIVLCPFVSVCHLQTCEDTLYDRTCVDITYVCYCFKGIIYIMNVLNEKVSTGCLLDDNLSNVTPPKRILRQLSTLSVGNTFLSYFKRCI